MMILLRLLQLHILCILFCLVEAKSGRDGFNGEIELSESKSRMKREIEGEDKRETNLQNENGAGSGGDETQTEDGPQVGDEVHQTSGDGPSVEGEVHQTSGDGPSVEGEVHQTSNEADQSEGEDNDSLPCPRPNGQGPLYILGWTKSLNGSDEEPVAIPASPDVLKPISNDGQEDGLLRVLDGPQIDPKCHIEALKDHETVPILPYKPTTSQRPGKQRWFGRRRYLGIGRIGWSGGLPGFYYVRRFFPIIPVYRIIRPSYLVMPF